MTGQTMSETIYGYASKEARDSGKQPLSAGKVQISGDEYVAGADRPRHAAGVLQEIVHAHQHPGHAGRRVHGSAAAPDGV